MDQLQYVKATPLSLRSHPSYEEQWLERTIADDPSVLGLGDLGLIERQRQQERAGRLDLLLADYDQNRRFEVELMLGPTDESHIIRAIEYWDIERRRYPAYDHVAVLVAEDITARFLERLEPLRGNRATGGHPAERAADWRHDHARLRQGDRPASTADRRRGCSRDGTYRPNLLGEAPTPDTVGLVDQLVEMVNDKAQTTYQAKYNKFSIGLSDGQRVNNFVTFSPKKKYTYVAAKVENDGWVERFEEAGLEAQVERDGYVRVKLNGDELDENRDLVAELLHAAADGH